MSESIHTCPLCRSDATRGGEARYADTYWYRCNLCGKFVIREPDERTLALNANVCAQRWSDRISAMLRERCLGFAVDAKQPTPDLRFTKGQSYDEIPGTVGIWIDELLAQYPQPSERVERCFRAFVRLLGEEAGFGKGISIDPTNYADHVLFAHSWAEARYLVEAMDKYGWLEVRPTQGTFEVRVSPHGWVHYDEVTRTHGSVYNPIFVAMWFGRGEADRTEEMRAIFQVSIRCACEDHGWRVKRADTDEHNDPIMDRVIADIRAAPFVIAELSENNQGVYYEAGFARGLGKEVIYCCPERQRVHFDLTGVNQVKWKDAEDLRKRLGDRILGTKGRGPHKFEEKVAR